MNSHRSIIWLLATVRFIVVACVVGAGLTFIKLFYSGQSFETEAQGIAVVVLICVGSVTIAFLNVRRWMRRRPGEDQYSK